MTRTRTDKCKISIMNGMYALPSMNILSAVTLHYTTGGVNKDMKKIIDDKLDRTAYEVKSGEITAPDRLFNDLAFYISEKYEVIGVELGLNYKSLCNELETGKYAMSKGNEKAMKMLQMWQESIRHDEDHFTYSVLATALEKYGFHNAACRFCYTEVTSNLRSKPQICVETNGAPTVNSKLAYF